MAERTSDWELVNSEQPEVYRHRGRGNLWVIDGDLHYIPGASLSDLIAMKRSIANIGKPAEPEPVKPAPPFFEFPKWVQPHPSWVSHPSGPPFVETHKFSVNRDTNVVSVYVLDRADEQRVMAPKLWRK